MDLRSPRESSEMPSVSVMAGPHGSSHQPASVGNPSLCSMICHAPLVVSHHQTQRGPGHHSGTSKAGRLSGVGGTTSAASLRRAPSHLHSAPANCDNQARLDVAASGIWGGQFERTFVDVWVFNPCASSNHSKPLAAAMSSMRGRRRGPMSSRFGRLNMHHLFRPCSQLVAE